MPVGGKGSSSPGARPHRRALPQPLRRFHLREVPIGSSPSWSARGDTIEVALTRCRNRLYAAFLSLPDRSDTSWWSALRGGQQPRLLGRFRAVEGEPFVLDIAKELNVAAETKGFGDG